MQHGQGRLGEISGGDLKELVAGVGLEDLQQVLARMARLAEAATPEELDGLASQDGDLLDALVVGRRREQPEESPFPDDVALLVERLDSDVVQVGRSMDGRPA